MKKLTSILCFLSILSVPSLVNAGIQNMLALGQGISSPAINSLPAFSNGFTTENPVGAVYQDAPRVSLGVDEGDEPGLMGAIGIGNGDYGIAMGYYDSGCDNCEGQVSGAAAGNVSSFGVGFGFRENLVSLGAILNPTETHRVGLVFDYGTNNSNYSALGLGYSYVADPISFAVDASQFEVDNESSTPVTDNDGTNVIRVTPGFSVRASMFAVALSYDMYINDTVDRDGNLWGGIGIGGDSQWHIAGYVDYVGEWNIIGTIVF